MYATLRRYQGMDKVRSDEVTAGSVMAHASPAVATTNGVPALAQ